MEQNSQPTSPPPSQQPTRALEKPAQEGIRTVRNVRTLIADDSPLMLKLLAKILAIEGHFTLVATVTDGCQVVRQTLNMKPELVLMDYSMPHLNGIEAARYIKQFKNPPLVIIVTSNDTLDCKALAEAAGADGFVVKGGNLHAQLRSIFHVLFQFAVESGPGRVRSNPRRPFRPRLTS
jgi:CheY-like chemotaxis protein